MCSHLPHDSYKKVLSVISGIYNQTKQVQNAAIISDEDDAAQIYEIAS